MWCEHDALKSRSTASCLQKQLALLPRTELPQHQPRLCSFLWSEELSGAFQTFTETFSSAPAHRPSQLRRQRAGHTHLAQYNPG